VAAAATTPTTSAFAAGRQPWRTTSAAATTTPIIIRSDTTVSSAACLLPLVPASPAAAATRPTAGTAADGRQSWGTARVVAAATLMSSSSNNTACFAAHCCPSVRRHRPAPAPPLQPLIVVGVADNSTASDAGWWRPCLGRVRGAWSWPSPPAPLTNSTRPRPPPCASARCFCLVGRVGDDSHPHRRRRGHPRHQQIQDVSRSTRVCSGSCPQSQRGITPSENPAQDADRYARVTTRTPGSLGAKRTKTTEATQTQR